MTDEMYMRRALRLAGRGRGGVSPNPMVGAVIVKGSRVVGEGYHRRAGDRHAEIVALDEAGKKAKNSTMYVNLEPCSHYGKTPPCVGRIIEAGVRRVVVAMKDPNPLVCGKGISKLKRAGVLTELGLFGEEAGRLNEVFVKFTREGVPFVIVKSAMTLDGKIATVQGDSKWISCEKARRFTHRLRSGVDGILVGINTVVEDNPRLNVRHGKCSSQPVKIVVDSRCRIPVNSRVFTGGRTIVAVTKGCSSGKTKELHNKTGAEVLVVKGNGARVDLKELMDELGKRQVMSLLIEGGGELAASAFSCGIVDKLFFFIAPRIVGGRCAPTPVGGEGIDRIGEAVKVSRMTARRFGEDILVEGYLN